jgi:hypothetical protein
MARRFKAEPLQAQFGRLIHHIEMLRRVPKTLRTPGEQYQIDSLLTAAFGWLDISGSYHPDDSLHNLPGAAKLRRMVKEEGL